MYVYKDIKYINMYICVSALHEVNISFFHQDKVYAF